MRLSDMVRSMGGVFIIAIGAIVAAVVGRYTLQWVFIPTFIVVVCVAFYFYYRMTRGEKR